MKRRTKKFFSTIALVLLVLCSVFAVACGGHNHELKLVSRQDATCTTDGTEAYYQCLGCGELFADEEGKTKITAPEVIPAGHELTYHAEEAKTCTADGMEEYWDCEVCEKLFSDANAENEIDEPIVIPMSHELTHHAEEAKTCTTDGTAEYWECGECEKLFSDANAENEIGEPVVIPMSHELTYHAEEAKTCTTDGTEEYWECGECQKLFGDECGDYEIGEPVVIPAGHEKYYVSYQYKTCTEDGHEAYYACDGCQKYFSATDYNQEINEPVVIPAGHELNYYEEEPKTCTADGTEEYWSCGDCYKYFSDANAENEIGEPVVIPRGHELIYHAQVDKTCVNTGTKEYWECDVCGSKYKDEAGTEYISSPIIIPSSHELTYHAQADKTCDTDGMEEYWQCDDCDKYFEDESGYDWYEIDEPVVIPMSHELTYHAQVNKTCDTDGTEEYWECNDCDKLFSDQECENQISAPVVIVKGHSFATEYSIDSKTHWYAATCSHSDLKSGEQEHVTDSNGDCTVCDGATYTLDLSYTQINNGTEYQVSKKMKYQNVVAPLGTELIIPAYYQGLPVTQVGSFQGLNNLEKVVLPETIKTISNSAFYYCRGIKEMTLPESVTKIGDRAFLGCSALEKINVPKNVTSIGTEAFATAENQTSVLKEVYYDVAGTPSLSAYTFARSGRQGEGINFIFGDNVTVIPNKLLAYDIETQSSAANNYTPSLLADATLSPKVKSITIGKSVTTIQNYAFNNLQSLEVLNLNAVALSDYATDFYNKSFFNMGASGSGITLNVGKDVTRIPGFFFACVDTNHTNTAIYLKKIVFEEGSKCTEIAKRAFNGCYLLESVNLPEGLTTIAERAFVACNSLKGIDLPSTLTSMGEAAFGNCSSITRVVIPDKLAVVPSDAFYECLSLKEVTISDGVTEICSEAFWDCPITVLNIGENSKLTTIGSSAFTNARMVSVYIPSGLTTYDSSFYGAETINKSSLNITNKNAKIIHDGESKIVKKGDFYFLKGVDGVNYLVGYVGNDQHIVLPDDIDGESYVLTSDVVYENNDVFSVVVSDGVTAIESYAFSRCYNLVSLTIGKNVTSIGEYNNVSRKLVEIINLSNVDVVAGDSDSLGRYAKYIHNGKSKIDYTDDDFVFITDAEGVNFLLGYAGDKTDVVTPDYYNSKTYRLSAYCLYGHENLTSLHVGKGVTHIEQLSAGRDGKDLLTSLTFATDSELTSIDSYAFYYAEKLLEVDVPEDIPIGSEAFSYGVVLK